MGEPIPEHRHLKMLIIVKKVVPVEENADE